MKEYAAYPITVSRTSSVNGRRYGSFLVAALRRLKSTQILNLPFFGSQLWVKIRIHLYQLGFVSCP